MLQLSDYTDLMPLSMVPAGQRVQLIAIQGGQRLRKRLADLGFNVGMSVRVIKADRRGPMILAIKEDTRLGVGRGITQNILVVAEENTQRKIS